MDIVNVTINREGIDIGLLLFIDSSVSQVLNTSARHRLYDVTILLTATPKINI